MKEEILKEQWNFFFSLCLVTVDKYNLAEWKPQEFMILERERIGGGVQDKL